MKKTITAFLAITAVFFMVSCSRNPIENVQVIPMPNNIEMLWGEFNAAGAEVSYDKALEGDRIVPQLQEFARQLSLASGQESVLNGEAGKTGFVFSIDPELPAETYTLEVKKNIVKAKACDFYGLFYALQTVKQLLPVEFFGKEAAPEADWSLPCMKINDYPRFGYRGLHSDICRHFFDVDQMKKYLDVMAMHKLNRLHWHLNDDQGWRIEIKKYPKLTEIGGWRAGTMIKYEWDSSDGIRYGGYYTQEQILEVVAYAESLGITVIPEIDLPGHMLAALAAYPNLGCTGGPYEVWKRWGVSKDVLCPGKEEVFTFIEDVLTEVMENFPSEYIHIGGDECPKTSWEKCPHCQKKIAELGLKDSDGHTAEQYLQNYVTARVQEFVNRHGRKIIGWDEILEGELAEGATVMSWRGVKGGIAAAKKGFDVIMTPNSFMYFDYCQSKEVDKEPFSIGHHLPVDSVYRYEPLQGLPEEAHKHILGVQANVWTEYIKTNEHLEYMVLPRLDALSEVQWCEPWNKDYARFEKSIVKMMAVYDELGYTYSRGMFGDYGLKPKN